MARPKNTEARRAQIAEGLLIAMGTAGYAETTTADIARAAGLTTGLVHYHFKSKRAVLLFAMERLAETVFQRFTERAAHAKDARERLIAFIDAYVGLGKDADPRAVACWVAIAAEAVRDDDVRALYQAAAERAFDELLALVKDAMSEAGQTSAGARAHAAVLWSAIQGSYQVATVSPGIVPRGSMASSLTALIDASLTPRAQRPAQHRGGRT
jgi:TetR/AcrR family transcriptional regulator, transcriptional repressor of bet genes